MILAVNCKKSASLVGKASRLLSPLPQCMGLMESSTAKEIPALTAEMTNAFSDRTSRPFRTNTDCRKRPLGPTLLLVVILSHICGLSAQVVQTYSRSEYREQLYQAVSTGDAPRVEALLQSQRGEAIRFIEAMLDSATVRKARNKSASSDEAWQTANRVAQVYAQVFNDNYYIERATRYNGLDLQRSQQKVRLLELKEAGRDHFLASEFEAARKSYEQALKLAEEIGDADEAAAMVGNIGAVAFYLGDFDAALDFYQKSLNQLEKLGDRRRVGNRLGNIATVYNDMSDYPAALSYYDRAMAVRKELNDQSGLAADLNNAGLVYEELGEYPKALQHYQAALALNRETDNNRRMGNNLANIANVHINLGDYPQAIKIYEDALALRKFEQDARGEANDYGNLGEVYKSLGDYKKAQHLFEQALEVHRGMGYREGEAYQLGRLAYMSRLKGHYAKALVQYKDALNIHRAIGHVRGEATWLTALGETYAEVGDYRQAMENLQQALALHRDIGNRSGEATTLNHLGYISLQNDKIQAAQTSFRDARVIVQQLQEQGSECLVMSNLAYTYGLAGDSSAAVTTWRQASFIAEELGERGLQGWIQLQLGDFFRDHDATPEAHEAYEQGLAISEGGVDSELRWQLYYGRGRLWEKAGEKERAFYSYQAAIAIIEEIRHKAVVEELKAGLIHDRFEAYEAMVGLLLSLGRTEDAFAHVERARSRSLLDLLGNAKIPARDSLDQRLLSQERALRARIDKLKSQMSTRHESEQGLRGSAIYRTDLEEAQTEYQRLLVEIKLRNPKQASLVTVEPFSASELAPLLGQDTALLEYFVTEDQTRIFVVTKEGLRAVTVDEGLESLRAKIVHFRGTAVHRMDEETLKESYWMGPLHKLYQILVEPVQQAGYLREKSHLIIVPQTLLAYLPFQALVTEIENRPTPRFLVEDYTISYAPSASTLKFFDEKAPPVSDSILLLAPNTNILPMSQTEVTNIAQHFGEGAEYLLADRASETLVKAQASGYDLLHFATTAQFNKANPIFSSLSLADSDEDDGSLDVNEIFSLDLNTSLVTLSACQTALGSGYYAAFPNGDDFISLTSAFLYAGSPAVVASLWEVADPSTSVFMQRFYQYLRQEGAAKALAMAQLDMISGRLAGGANAGSSRYAHPYFWAPFILVGDWQ